MKRIFVLIALCLALVQQLTAWTAPGKSSADISLSGTDSPDPATVGDRITYSFQILNRGPANATSVTLSDTLPQEVTHISSWSSQGSCAGTTTVTCSLGTLAANSGASVDVVVEANVAGPITNRATVSASQKDPATSDNSVSLTTEVREVTQPSVSADMLVSGVSGTATRVFVKSAVRIGATIRNDGHSPATLVKVTVSGALGLTAASTKGICAGATCTIPILQPGESASVSAAGIGSNPYPSSYYCCAYASVSAAEPDPNYYNNDDYGYISQSSVTIPDICGRLCPP